MGAIDLAGLPLWMQIAVTAFAGVGVAIAAAKAYLKQSGEPAQPKGEAVVVAGTVTDRRSMQEIVDAIRAVTLEMRDSREQRHRDSLEERTCFENLARAVRENTEVQRETPALINTLAQIEKLTLKS